MSMCHFMHYFCFFSMMATYLCTFKRFCRTLKARTDLRAIEASTENMDDEEKTATLNKAAQPQNKKCKRVVKKQAQAQP